MFEGLFRGSLSRSHWQGVRLEKLVRGELAFCASQERVVIEGPRAARTSSSHRSVGQLESCYGCWQVVNNQYSHQFETSGGVTIRF